MTIRLARVLIVVAAAVIGLAGCASYSDVGDAGAADKAADAAASPDTTGSIPVPPSARPVLPSRAPPPRPAEAPFILLGVAY